MRTLLLLAVVVVTSGCATAIPYSKEETCAFDGMKLGGVTHSSGSTSLYDPNSGRVLSADSSGKGFSCVPPESEKDKCEIDRLNLAVQPKVDYNSNLGTKKWVTGVGYVLYIVPGVVAKLVYDGKYDTAMEKSQEIASKPENSCRAPASLSVRQ